MPTSRGPYRGAELEDLARIIEGKQKSAAVSRGFLGLLLDKWLISNGLADPEQFPDVAALETPAALVDKSSERPSSTLKVAQKLDRIARCSDQLSRLLSDNKATIGLHSHIRLAITGRKAKESTSDHVRKDIEAGRFLKELQGRLALLQSAARKRKHFLQSGISRGRKKDIVLSSALYELGHVFIDATGQNVFVEELPYSENSRFIRFASAVLGPLFPEAETTSLALARRFKRENPRREEASEGDHN